MIGSGCVLVVVGSAAFLFGAVVVVPIFAARRDREDGKSTPGIAVRIQFEACCESTSSSF